MTAPATIAVWAAASPFLPATTRTLDEEAAPYLLLPEALDAAALARAAAAEALVVGGDWVTAELLGSLPRLRLVVRGGVGFDKIDLPAATRLGIMVTNVVDYGTNEVADHTMLLMLAAIRRLGHFTAEAHGGWRAVRHIPVPRVHGRRLGIIGLGRIGTAVAQRARGFGLEVVAHDPLIGPDAVARRGATAVTLDELLATSDVISLHTPLTPETYHLLDRAAFARMRRTPVIVNTARGGLVDTRALVDALAAGLAGAAGLDVLEGEPDVAAHRSLLGRDDVVVTPHVAWYSQGSEEQLGRTAARLALDFVRHGSRPRLLNPDVAVRSIDEVTP
ncbi:C-terminal binding protein [Jiangella muralis]|uniref:C-terminal binding protein n=1 Tax=Jiangella muralis TaxID=702383 RepID=UPI00069DC173|nr:C-terminal binding protein [Jiangella muralis]